MTTFYLSGGTVDITAHEVVQNGCLRELLAASGGNWGGTKVDEEYLDFIKCFIGDSVTESIEQSKSYVFYEVSRDFENVKRSIKPHSDKMFTTRMPFEISEEYERINPGRKFKSIEVVLTKKEKKVGVSIVGSKLRIASKDAEDFFTESLEAIVSHLNKLLEQENGPNVSTFILVGGYAESPMLVRAIKAAFPEKRIIVPKEAAWTVLSGAVVFGHDPTLIKMRRTKYIYGLSVFERFDYSKHDTKYRYIEDGEIRCGRLFSKLIDFAKPAAAGEYHNANQYIIHKLGRDGNLKLYTSTNENTKYVDEKGCSFVGYILPKGHGFLLKETINVMLSFGETQVKIKVHQPKSNQTQSYHLGHTFVGFNSSESPNI